MKSTNLVKTAVFCAGGVAGTLGVMALAPAQALAVGWQPKDMMTNAGSEGGVKVNAITSTQINTWVTSITSWILAIAVIIFVLRLVLTAVDRMIFANNSGGFSLTEIPIVGAYKADKLIKDILKNFALQLGIAVGAWLIVQIIMNAILWVFGALTA